MKNSSSPWPRLAERGATAGLHRLAWRRLLGMAISASVLMVAMHQAAAAFGLAARLLPPP